MIGIKQCKNMRQERVPLWAGPESWCMLGFDRLLRTSEGSPTQSLYLSTKRSSHEPYNYNPTSLPKGYIGPCLAVRGLKVANPCGASLRGGAEAIKPSILGCNWLLLEVKPAGIKTCWAISLTFRVSRGVLSHTKVLALHTVLGPRFASFRSIHFFPNSISDAWVLL